MLKVLAQAPERWSKIYCLSRRPGVIKEGLSRNAGHVALDFLKRPEGIAGVRTFHKIEVGSVLADELTMLATMYIGSGCG
jgi:hypothetical protein